MEKSKSHDDVAVFIDFENVYVSVREKFDATPNFELIMDRCEDYGRIVIARAYADWYRYPRVTSALFANGVEPMYVPTYYYDREVGRTGRPIKNSVDIHLCIDAMRTLYTQTHIDKFVLVTGDRDFIPLVNAIRQHGKEVIIIGIGGAASAHLAQSGDEFLFYEQIADLKSPQQQRQEQQAARSEKREREKTERAERPERERGDGNGKVEKREREKTERAAAAAPAPEPVAAEPEPSAPEPSAPERSVYDTLVDAINLARQRGFVSNLGSLKVLMRELDSSFNESKVKDSNGKPFTKFKDFVKEAERLGKVQIFTNGTVTEVFLPGEDPLRVSQFAEDLASEQVERELESELDAQESQQAPTEAAPVAEPERPEMAAQPSLPGVTEAAAAQTPAAEEPVPAEEHATPTTFGDREWQVFLGTMSQFNDPVRFVEIFSALRGLRNQEVFELTNNELKELVKQAINRGVLQRTGRGARAYYRLSSQYRVPADGDHDETAAAVAEVTRERAAPAASDVVEESAAGLVNVGGMAPAARRRGRAYELLAPSAEASGATDALAAAAEPTVEQPLPLTETIAEEVAVQTAGEPSPTKTRRNRRKKSTATTPETQPIDPDAAANAGGEANGASQSTQLEAQAEQPAGNNGDGAKKRRNRRKKPAAKADEGAAQAETNGE